VRVRVRCAFKNIQATPNEKKKNTHVVAINIRIRCGISQKSAKGSTAWVLALDAAATAVGMAAVCSGSSSESEYL
jgi:hypothetical protein